MFQINIDFSKTSQFSIIMANYDSSLLHRHMKSLRLELGSEVKSHCFNALLGELMDSAYFTIQECLLHQNHMKFNFENAMASWILDHTRKDTDAATPSEFTTVAEIMDGVYNMTTKRTKFGPMFINLVKKLKIELPNDQNVLDMETAVNTVPAQVNEAFIRAVDPKFLAVARGHSDIWRKVYRKFDNKHALASMIGGITALCHRGTMTNNHLKRVMAGVSEVCDLGEVLTVENAGTVYRIIKALIPANVDSRALFLKFEEVFTAETNLRLHLVMKQAAKSGVSLISIIMQAMKLSQNCAVWSYLNHRVPAEVQAFKRAAEAVTANPYIGFDLGGNLPDHMRSTLFKSLLAAALTVLKTVNPKSNVQKFRNVPNSECQDQITKIVDNWVEGRGADALAEKFAVGGDAYVDMKDILNAQADVWAAFE